MSNTKHVTFENEPVWSPFFNEKPQELIMNVSKNKAISSKDTLNKDSEMQDSQEHNIDEVAKPNITIVNNDSNTEITKYKPILTRNTMSKYEFVHTITSAAKFLYSLSNIEKFCGKLEINELINPSELAFKLLMNHKLDAVIDRLGYEKVSFSELIINPIWVSTIENYFEQKHITEQKEVLEPFNLM